MNPDLAAGLWVGGWLAALFAIAAGAAYAQRGEVEHARFLRWLSALPVLVPPMLWVLVLPSPWNVATGLASILAASTVFGWRRIPPFPDPGSPSLFGDDRRACSSPPPSSSEPCPLASPGGSPSTPPSSSGRSAAPGT